MNQRKRPVRQTPASSDCERRSFPPFTIANLRTVEYGRICARFDLEVGPVRLLECNVVADSDGRPQFVSTGAIKDRWTGEYRSLVELDRDFRGEIFDAVTARLAADHEQSSDEESETPARDAWAEDQEAQFERAMAELDGAA